MIAVSYPLVEKSPTPLLIGWIRDQAEHYGKLVTNYVEGFEEKWIRRRTSGKEELLGSGDIQSLADLGNSYSVVSEMRRVPLAVWCLGCLITNRPLKY